MYSTTIKTYIRLRYSNWLSLQQGALKSDIYLQIIYLGWNDSEFFWEIGIRERGVAERIHSTVRNSYLKQAFSKVPRTHNAALNWALSHYEQCVIPTQGRNSVVATPSVGSSRSTRVLSFYTRYHSGEYPFEYHM